MEMRSKKEIAEAKMEREWNAMWWDPYPGPVGIIRRVPWVRILISTSGRVVEGPVSALDMAIREFPRKTEGVPRK